MNPPPISACDGKIRHASHREAAIHKRGLMARGGRPVESYLCGSCGFWHVGGSKAYKKRRVAGVSPGVYPKRSRRVMGFEES